MEELLVLFLQFFGEMLIYLVFELVADAAMHCLEYVPRRHAWIIHSVVFGLLGAIAGFISILIFPEHFLRNRELQLLNLLVTPTLAGIIMHQIGHLLQARKRKITGLESFAGGFAFALLMAIVRFNHTT